MHKKAYLVFLFIFASLLSRAQTTYLPMGSDDYLLLDRLETRTGRLSDSLCLSAKVESRKTSVRYLENLMHNLNDSLDSAHYSRIDLYGIRQMISESGEWTADENGALPSKHPWFHTFYKTQYNFAYIKTRDFFVIVNPVLNAMSTTQHNDALSNANTALLLKGMPGTISYNSHDAEVRGWIGKKIGFYSLFTDNQEILPAFLYNDVNKTHMAVPGAPYFIPPTNLKTGAYNYIQASGYIDFAAIKDHINITFGSGKHFYGDGLSSLFLTDYSGNIPFLQIRTRLWKINYDCLYLELTQQYNKNLGDAVYNHKFATVHYLSYNVARWMSLGFFEAVVFDRPNVYEASYLNPAIIALSLNSFNGSGDKSLLGFNGKIIAAKHVQLYGQVVLNEFRTKELLSNRGWYGNKWGIQAGAKYFDALGIKNLDLQGEVDMVRPYTYSAQDTLDNYSNYNQPLADPLGSGFIKGIGTLRYKPGRNMTFNVRGMYYVHGEDTGSKNYGNNIFNSYLAGTSGSNTYGVRMINGPESRCQSIDVSISYQLFRNVFLDIGGLYRHYTNIKGIYPDYSTIGKVDGPLTSKCFYFGLRINAPKREYNAI